MAESDLDLVLHLGDYIYEYPEAGYANNYAREALKRSVVPQHEVVALEDYRMRYGLSHGSGSSGTSSAPSLYLRLG